MPEIAVPFQAAVTATIDATADSLQSEYERLFPLCLPVFQSGVSDRRKIPAFRRRGEGLLLPGAKFFDRHIDTKARLTQIPPSFMQAGEELACFCGHACPSLLVCIPCRGPEFMRTNFWTSGVYVCSFHTSILCGGMCADVREDLRDKGLRVCPSLASLQLLKYETSEKPV